MGVPTAAGGVTEPGRSVKVCLSTWGYRRIAVRRFLVMVSNGIKHRRSDTLFRREECLLGSTSRLESYRNWWWWLLGLWWLWLLGLRRK
jgi:hypothetical protein